MDGTTYLPFTIRMDWRSLADSRVVLYIRVVDKKQLFAAPSQRPPYPWDNIHVIDLPADGRVSRAMAVKPGEYEAFIAVKEQTRAPQPNQRTALAAPAKMGLVRRTITVPDFNLAGLTMSSVILAASIEAMQSANTPDQQKDDPYAFGSMRIVPSHSVRLSNAGRRIHGRDRVAQPIWTMG